MLHKYNRLLNFLVPFPSSKSAVVFDGLCLNLLLLLASRLFFFFFFSPCPRRFDVSPQPMSLSHLLVGPAQLLRRRGDPSGFQAACVQPLCSFPLKAAAAGLERPLLLPPLFPNTALN